MTFNEKELLMIRGKMLVNAQTKEESHKILNYINELESLLDKANREDFFGTEGWQYDVFGEGI